MMTLSQTGSWLLQAGTSTRIAPWRSTAPGTTRSRVSEAEVPKRLSDPESGGTSSSDDDDDDDDDDGSGDSDSGKAPSSLLSGSSRHCHVIELTIGCAQVGVCRNLRHGVEGAMACGIRK